jgi:hypothetical protein
MKKKFRYSKILVFLFLISFTACNDLDQIPTNKFTEDNYWTSADKALSVLNMAYNQMDGNNIFFRNECLSDNLYEGRGFSDEKRISSGQADAAVGRFADMWYGCYAGIKTCHTFLENVDRVSDMDESLKNRTKAEARFIRAYLFFRLATWFGDVPFFTTDITLSESKTIARTPHANVIEFIRNELEDIAPALPTNRQYAEKDRGRITSGAAIALKARVYLYENDWPNVAATCERLIDKTTYGEYGLFNSYEGLFLPQNEYNREVILDFGYVPALKTWDNYFNMAPLSVGARLNGAAPTQELVDDYIMLNGKGIFDAGSGYNEDNPYVNRDPRLTTTVVYHGFQWKLAAGGTKTIYIKPGTAPDDAAKADEYQGSETSNATATGYYLRKYYDPTVALNIGSGLNLILIRYADVLLMYAEAKNELGELDETVWGKTIRAIRARAGFTDAGALNFNSSWTPEERQNIIRRERRCELMLEGLRIFDIRRWRTAEVVLNAHPHGAKFANGNTEYILLGQRSFNPGRDYLWPVPQSEKDINPNLGQNPNY